MDLKEFKKVSSQSVKTFSVKVVFYRLFRVPTYSRRLFFSIKRSLPSDLKYHKFYTKFDPVLVEIKFSSPVTERRFNKGGSSLTSTGPFPGIRSVRSLLPPSSVPLHTLPWPVTNSLLPILIKNEREGMVIVCQTARSTEENFSLSIGQETESFLFRTR